MTHCLRRPNRRKNETLWLPSPALRAAGAASARTATARAADTTGAGRPIHRQRAAGVQVADRLDAGGTVSPDAAFLWDVYPPVGVESVANGSHFTFTGPAGQYVVTLRSFDWTAKKISQATLTVTIGSAPPNPNPPGPGPQPPAPGNLTATLQAAYAKDTDSDRAKSLAFLQSAYAAL